MCQSELGVAAHAKKRLDAWVFEASVSYIARHKSLNDRRKQEVLHSITI